MRIIGRKTDQISKIGFTLIELLVVIAIIAILAAILFPVFAAAREKARQASCASNEKQIALAVVQYVQDYDEMPPSGQLPFNDSTTPASIGDGWGAQIYPYIKSTAVFTCPDDPGAGGTYDMLDSQGPGGFLETQLCSYAYNPNLLRAFVDNGGSTPESQTNAYGQDDYWNSSLGMYSTAKLASPASTVLLTEVKGDWTDIAADPEISNDLSATSNGVYCDDDDQNVPGSTQAVCVNGPIGDSGMTQAVGAPLQDGDAYQNPARHAGTGCNYAFWDGHVKFLRGSQVSPGGNNVNPLGTYTSTCSVNSYYLCWAIQTQGTFPNGTKPAATYSIF